MDPVLDPVRLCESDVCERCTAYGYSQRIQCFRESVSATYFYLKPFFPIGPQVVQIVSCNISKAFDTVNRLTLWKILLKLGCPERFVGLIRSLHNGMKARVSFNSTLSEEISINNGVKQSDISAPMLFNIYFAIVFLVAFYENSDGIYIRYRTSGSVFNVRRLLFQRKVSSLFVRELFFADDCDIVAHSKDELQCFMNHFVSACNSFGLKINLNKTVVMYDPAPGSPYIEPIIFVEGK